jgi:hypothetical protein
MPRFRTFVIAAGTLILLSLVLVTHVQQPGHSSASIASITPTLPVFFEVHTSTPTRIPIRMPTRRVTDVRVATITALPDETDEVTPNVTIKILPEVTVSVVSANEQTGVDEVRVVNGVPVEMFIVMPEDVKARVQEIFLLGQEMGRNPRAFSKLGDSTIENPQFMTRFDNTEFSYNLAEFDYLQPVIDFYRGSFGREGAAVRRGLHTWSVFDPMWATDPACMSGETMLECEFRVWNPSILFVRMGSNDSGIPGQVEKNLKQIVEFSLENGVIPIMGTKADRFEGSNINNQIIRQIAADYQVPLWDFDLIAGTIPGRGLGDDRVHMTYFFEHDYSDPRAYRTGNGIHTLTGLMMLEAIWLDVRELVPVRTPPYAQSQPR